MGFLDDISRQKDLYDKSNCPDCIFKNVKVPMVGVPYPPNIFAILVSRDPTIKFISYYKEAKQKSPDECRRFLLNLNAPPVWIINRIEQVSKKWTDNELSEESIARLRSIFKDHIYWTHLHKCCTQNDSKNKRESGSGIPAFNNKSAMICAERWLDMELVEAIEAGAPRIICLGKDVEASVSEWKAHHQEIQVKIYYLPHPSGANNAIWFSKDESLRKKILSQIIELLEDADNFYN